MEKATRLSWPVLAPYIQANFPCSFSAHLFLDKPSGTTVNNPLLGSRVKREHIALYDRENCQNKNASEDWFFQHTSLLGCEQHQDSVIGATHFWVTRSDLTASFSNFDSLPSVTQVAGVHVDLGQYMSTSKACASRRSPIFSKQQSNSGAWFWTWSLTALGGHQIHQSFSQCLRNKPDPSEYTQPKPAGRQEGATLLQNPSLRPKQPPHFSGWWSPLLSPLVAHTPWGADWRPHWWWRPGQSMLTGEQSWARL